MIDYQVYFGAKVDREDNRLRGLNRIQSNRKNYKGFVPSDVDYGEILSTSMQLLLRVETNLKLNLIDL